MGSALGASYYQVVLLRMGEHNRPGFVRCPAYLPAGETLRLRLKAARSQRASDRQSPQQSE
jgi:hypothetical protein